jgi:F0F1-type ATP synthase epsilon subunit
MRYQVRFVSDTALPEGVEYAFARQGNETYLFVKRGAVDVTSGRCDALTRAWERWEDADAAAAPLRLTSV